MLRKKQLYDQFSKFLILFKCVYLLFRFSVFSEIKFKKYFIPFLNKYSISLLYETE